MVEHKVSAVGELYIKPTKEELLVKNTKPRFGIKMKEMAVLPKDIILQFKEDGK